MRPLDVATPADGGTQTALRAYCAALVVALDIDPAARSRATAWLWLVCCGLGGEA